MPTRFLNRLKKTPLKRLLFKLPSASGFSAALTLLRGVWRFLIDQFSRRTSSLETVTGVVSVVTGSQLRCFFLKV